MFQSVSGRLATMRKPQEFTPQPMSDGRVLVQSDKSIGIFDPATGKGVLNQKGSYYPHLSPALGAFVYEFPAEFVAACMAALPTPGGQTDLGSVIVNHTIEVI